MSTYHCSKCAESAKKKKKQKKVSLRFKDDAGSKKASTNKSSHYAAILAKIDEPIPIKDNIVFGVGIGNNKSFRVSDDGSTFVFTQSGVYRIVFKGRINSLGKIVLHRTPPLSDKQSSFTKYAFGGDIQEISTMLPFQSGYELSIEFVSRESSKKTTYLEAGAQIEIYKVDDI